VPIGCVMIQSLPRGAGCYAITTQFLLELREAMRQRAPPHSRKRGSIHGKIKQFTRSAEQYSEAVRGYLPTLVQSPVGEMRNSSTSGRPRRCSASVSPFLRSLLRITIRYSNCLPPSVRREARFATENPCS
jgi:hypothetical protein